jgi:CARDB/Domain of unknown function DUF11/PQQ-like domain
MLKRMILSCSLVALTLALLPANNAAANWGNVLHDAQHSGKTTTAAGPSYPGIKWSYQHPNAFDPITGWTTDASFHAGIVEGPDGTIYTGGSDNNAYAFNADGSVKHIWYGVGLCCGPPAVGPDGTVYFLSDGLFAFDPTTFELKFHMAGPGGCCSGITVASDGKVYVGSGILYAIDPNNLINFDPITKEISSNWEGYYNDGWFPALSPDNQTVYFADARHIFAINAVDGTIWWSQSITNPGAGAPTVTPAGIVYIADDQKIIAIDPSLIPAASTPNDGVAVPQNPPAAAIRTVISTPGKQFTNISLDPTTFAGGTLVSAAYGFTLDVDGVTRICDPDGLIYSINETTGAVRWTQPISGTSTNATEGPAVKLHIDKTGAIYTTTTDRTVDDTDYAAHLYAFNASGSLIFEYFIPTMFYSDVRTLVISDSGTVYALLDGAVKAFGGIADVSVATSATPSPLYTNSTFTYTTTVNNAGPDKAKNLTLKQVFDKKLIGTINVVSIVPALTDPNHSCTISGQVLNCTLDDLANAGSVTIAISAIAPSTPANLTATVTAKAEQADPNVTNNAGSLKTPVVTPPPPCDLTVTAVAPPSGTVTRGTTKYNFTATVKNVGAGSCAASTVGFYFSADTTITNGSPDTWFGDVAVNSLAGGASQNVTLNTAIPTTRIAAGSYYIGAYADRNSVVTETSETNNTRSTTTKKTIN